MRCSQKVVHGLPWFDLSEKDRFVLQGVWGHFTVGILFRWTGLGSFKGLANSEGVAKT